MLSENSIDDDNKQISDTILKDINYGDILMQYTPPEKDIKIEQKTPETLNLKTFYCHEEKIKNHRYFVQVKQSVKNI